MSYTQRTIRSEGHECVQRQDTAAGGAASSPEQKPTHPSSRTAHTLSVASPCPEGLAAHVALFPERWMPLRPSKPAAGASPATSPHRQTLPTSPPPNTRKWSITYKAGAADFFKIKYVTNIFSNIFIILDFFFLFLSFSRLGFVWSGETHSHSKLPPRLLENTFSPKLRERRLLRFYGARDSVKRTVFPVKKEGRRRRRSGAPRPLGCRPSNGPIPKA